MAFDYSLPIQSVMNAIDTGIASTAKTVSTGIAGPVTEVMSACFGIYLLLVVVNHRKL
jgi:hypothetical protein